MNFKPITLIVSLFLLFSMTCFSQKENKQGYDIFFKVKGLKNGLCQLGYYAGSFTVQIDSVSIDSTTMSVRFKNSKPIEQGQYFIAINNNPVVDLMIDDDTVFEVQTDAKALIDSMKITGSKESEIYLLWQKKYNRFKQNMEQFEFNRNLLQRATRDPEAFAPIRNSMMQERKALDTYYEVLCKDYSKSMSVKFLKASNAPKIPEDIKPIFEKNSPNPAYYKYARAHFWDYFDFKDNRLMRSKIVAQKLKTHLQQLTFQQPDSVNNEVDKIMEKVYYNKKMMSFFLKETILLFDDNEKPGADNIFVHVVDEFFPNEKDTTYADLATVVRLRYKADITRGNLTGKLAKDIKLRQPNGRDTSLFDLKSKFTMVYFYSPLCSHCQAITPKIHAIFSKYKAKGLAAYAVNTDKEEENWKNYVQSKNLDWVNVIDRYYVGTWEKDYAAYNLPVIYLLDEKKNIILKRLSPEQLEEVLGKIFEEKN
jgi:thiol-disulfide isomerase/thioredoxin